MSKVSSCILTSRQPHRVTSVKTTDQDRERIEAICRLVTAEMFQQGWNTVPESKAWSLGVSRYTQQLKDRGV